MYMSGKCSGTPMKVYFFLITFLLFVYLSCLFTTPDSVDCVFSNVREQFLKLNIFKLCVGHLTLMNKPYLALEHEWTSLCHFAA